MFSKLETYISRRIFLEVYPKTYPRFPGNRSHFWVKIIEDDIIEKKIVFILVRFHV